jgi:hypothetical protein
MGTAGPWGPQYRAQAQRFRCNVAEAAYLQISAFVPDPALARWAAQTAPAVAIEAIIGWLGTG